jgi:predicted metal-dependent enzyme (double-stranded beta helix superfamily)
MHRPLREFVQNVTQAIDGPSGEDAIVSTAERAMQRLVAEDNWLPDEFAQCLEATYSQHLLYCDPFERFCVVSFVWQPGQRTPVHDHTVWGVIGQLVGEEESQSYIQTAAGQLLEQGAPEILRRGQTSVVSPRTRDVHVVRNPSLDKKAISIHAYGANIGRVSRHVYDLSTGRRSPFISSYTNTHLPNIWN